MTTAELLEAIKTALSTDAPLLSWCQNTFGKAPKICTDEDTRDPLEPETDYPAVVVSGIQQSRGDAKQEIEWSFELGVGVLQPEIIESEDTKTLTGFIQAETLRELTENALYRARIGNMDTKSVPAIDDYPSFLSISFVTIKTLRSNRRGLPG